MSDPRTLPWSESCFVCGDANSLGLGVRFVADEQGVYLETVLDERYEGYPGHAHGGIITALLDETIGWACTVTAGRLYFTVELTVRFKKPVPAGQKVTVYGRVDSLDNKVARGNGWIEDEHGTRLATATGVFFPLSQQLHDQVVEHLKVGDRAATQLDITGLEDL